MRSIRWPSLFCLMLRLPLPGHAAIAPADLAAVEAARRELGARRGDLVLAIANANPGRPYPRDTCALVFAFRDALWFYCPVDGTQPLSRRLHRVAEDRAHLLGLLRRIEPGFASCRELSAGELAAAGPAATPLRNGCFVDSLAAARRRKLRGEPGEGRLLSYYVRKGDATRGHTILVVKAGRATRVYDPLEPGIREVDTPGQPLSPLDWARYLVPAAQEDRLVKALVIAVVDSG